MLSKFWQYLLETLLLFALAEPIVCTNGETLTSRQDRSSSYGDISHYISRNMNNVMDDTQNLRTKSMQEQQLQQQQQQSQQQQHTQQQQQQQPPQHHQPHFVETRKSSEHSSLDDTIFSIFKMGPEPGLRLFNTTLETHLTPITGMQADESFIDRSSQKEQAFKVQRTPDGKLNLVFNDYLFFQKPTKSELSTTARPLNRDFVFPDQLMLYGDSHSKCLEGMGEDRPFCTKVSKYPQLTDLEKTLRREFKAFFGEDLPQQPENVTQRMNNEPDEEVLCESTERIIFPEAGLTKDADWLLIVNNNLDFKQGVRIEECSHEGRQCNVLNSLPNHYQATCKQNYIYRSLVAVTNNGTIQKNHFKMPSCCKCVLKQVH